VVRIKKYYALAVKDKEASIYIFGDIVSWELFESDVSSYSLVKEIESLPEDIETINVFINSYGGEVAEGLAIYNQLRRHKAKVRTYCEGFACSAASVVFMAGDERIMSNASLLMIHNAWMLTWGDQNELRKYADDLETINAATIQAYMNHISISEEELKAMMDAETWISAADALEKGFATAVVNPAATDKAAASLRLRKQMADMILNQQSSRQFTGGFISEGKANIDLSMGGLTTALEARLKELIAQKSGHGPDPTPTPEPEPEPEPEDNKPKNLMAALFAAEGD